MFYTPNGVHYDGNSFMGNNIYNNNNTIIKNSIVIIKQINKLKRIININSIMYTYIVILNIFHNSSFEISYYNSIS